MPVFANSTETRFIIYNNRKINKQLNYNTKSEDINWQEKNPKLETAIWLEV